MKYLYTLIVGILLLAIFYFVQENNKDIGLVESCQDRTGAECKINQLPYNNYDLSIEERASDLLKRMTFQEKVGQMMLIERNSLKNNNDVVLYGLGGLLSGMGSKPEINTPEGWLSMVNEYTRLSRTTRLGIPLIYGADAIHGHTNIEKATVFPHFIGLGASDNTELVKQVALATTEELAASGVYWNFSPNLDVLGDPRWGRFFESFGSDPSLVAKMGTAYLEGIAVYNASSYKPIGTAKYFFGSILA